jgi:hypothetical protein
MMFKESDNMIDLVPFQTGDQISKANKNGQVIKVSDEGVLVMWKDGKMSIEELHTLTKQKNPFIEYLKREKRL